MAGWGAAALGVWHDLHVVRLINWQYVMLHAHWHAYQWSTSYWKLPALSVVAGVMSRGSGWLRLEPWSLGLLNGSSKGVPP